ncbi:MAG: PA14 domain-containing protein, partial [Verrucomicrobiota bacterium]
MKTDSCLPVARTGKVIAVSLLAVAAFTGRSYSQLSLGIDFQGRTPADVSSPAMAATETAGVPGFNFSNWNSVDNHVLGRTATSGPLSYSNGTASGVTISYSSNDEWNGPNAAYNGQLNDDHLYYGIIKQQNVGSSADFTLNNLSGDGTKYDLFVYYLTNNADNADGSAGGRKMDLSLNNGAQIKFVRESTFTYGGSYIEGISTDVNNRDSFASNYAKFSGLSAVDLDGNGSFELKLQAFNQAINDGIGIAGFALIQYAPVSAVKQWNIASGVWDTTTANWLDSNNLASTYLNGQPGDQVVFGNSGAAGARTVTIASPVTPASVTVNNNAGNNYTINGVIGDGGFNSPLTKNGAGELTLTSANTFGGSVLLKHGTVNVATIGDAATDGNLGKGSGITLGDAGGLNDAVLNYTGTSATLARDISVESTGGAINVPASQTLSFNHLTGSGAFTKGGAGNIAFTATSLNGLTGSLTVPAGTLSVAKLGSGSGSISLGSTAAAGLIYGGGSLKDGRSLVVGAGGATITVSNADALYQLAGATTATAGRLTVAGPGRLALDGAAAFAQMPIINAGATLALRNETGNTLPAGPIDVAGGTLELAPGAFTAGTAFNLIGGTLRLGHEGLQGNYYTGGYDQNGLLNALGGTYGGVTGHFANLGDPALTARTNTGGRTDLNFDNTNGGNAAPFADQGLNDTDNIRSSFSGKILITTAGLTGFSTRSDDGSAIFIDGQRVVNNNFFQGMTTRSGTIDLTAGLHDIF